MTRSTTRKKRVAIIGAGPSGLSQLHAFQIALNVRKGSRRDEGDDVQEEIPDIVCFEKQDNWGGQWQFSWRTGVDDYGEPIHNSMYRYLWSNGPKESIEYADYSFDKHFGKPIASFPPRAVILNYLEGRAKQFPELREKIRFNTVCRMVEELVDHHDNEASFKVTVEDLKEQRMYSEVFDYVIVATGHFSTPNVPYYSGFESFAGRLIHAHDFRDASQFKDKDILILGSSYSAEDIGSQCWKYECKSVTISHRWAPIGYDWPDNWHEVPGLIKVEENGNTAYFEDGTTKDVDAIILCTGYKHYFPFMPDHLRLECQNVLATPMLYKGVAFINNPKIFYLGMQDQWYTFNLFEAQAWWVRDVILGRINIPPKSDMQADIENRIDIAWELEGDHEGISYQGAYIKELMDETDCPTFEVTKSNQILFDWLQHKENNIMTYRDYGHVSAITGTKAPSHHTPWKECLDDSIEDYLRDV